MADDGSRHFPNAQYYITQADYDFWTTENNVPAQSKVFWETATKNLKPNRERMQFIKDGEEIIPGVHAMLAPGHTVGHIAFHIVDGGAVLCGDTLFSLGCGRLLEGTAAQMFESLRKLAALPEDTLVCCGHEYTESNARFALSVDANNTALKARTEQAHQQRAAGQPTVPSTMASELEANPFLRAPDVATFADLRAKKDKF